MYMGFNEIYLLGVDCNYVAGTKSHFRSNGNEFIVNPKLAKKQNDDQRLAYQIAEQEATKRNVKIYNATRGGKLEVFERVDLDEVLNEKR
jgi:hypothetical protein